MIVTQMVSTDLVKIDSWLQKHLCVLEPVLDETKII